MAYVRNANVILEVKDYEVERYLGLGYNHINPDGTIITEAVPRDVGQLTKAYNDHKAEIAKLKAEIEGLKAELAKKKTKAKAE